MLNNITRFDDLVPHDRGLAVVAIDSMFASFAFRNTAAAIVSNSGGIAAGMLAIKHPAPIAICRTCGDTV